MSGKKPMTPKDTFQSGLSIDTSEEMKKALAFKIQDKEACVEERVKHKDDDEDKGDSPSTMLMHGVPKKVVCELYFQWPCKHSNGGMI